MADFFYIFLFTWAVFGLLSSPAAAASGAGIDESQSQREREADRVVHLPGQPAGNVGFEQYAGYVKVRQGDEKALFYWLFEAPGGAADKPLLLWLNGGPGCSSIAYGAMQELGPFLVRNNSQLILNKFSWNKVANVLFLEAPVGVGFSYSNKSEDMINLGDSVTALDSYDFLIRWFQRFPQFASRQFYIAGESYAGHYVPQLAELIYEKNKGAKKGSNSIINLKGFLIGNAVVNDATDQQGFIDYAWSHAIVSDKVHGDVSRKCDFRNATLSSICNIHLKGFFQAYSDIDIYNIYAPVCFTTTESTASRPGRNPHQTLNAAPRFFSEHEIWRKLPSGYDPCTEEYVESYFNREDVQQAIHANLTKLSYPYTPCSSVIKNWNDSPDTVLPIIKKLLNAGMRIWIFSGDTDGRVPVTSTRYSIKEMGLRVKEEWRAWFHKQQVGGWVETYQGGGGNLNFITVRGAGHQVPMFVPPQALSLFSHFLKGTPLPTSSR